MVACSFTYNIHRGTFAFCNLSYVVNSLFIDKQSHTFLRFVCDDFLSRKSLVTDRKLVHVDKTTAIFYKFRQTVYVTCRTVVVDRNDWVFIFFTK